MESCHQTLDSLSCYHHLWFSRTTCLLPFRTGHLDDYLIPHCYSCCSSGWFENSHRQPFQYLNVFSVSLVLPFCFGPGNHHFLLGLLAFCFFPLVSPLVRFQRCTQLLHQNGKSVTLQPCRNRPAHSAKKLTPSPATPSLEHNFPSAVSWLFPIYHELLRACVLVTDL